MGAKADQHLGSGYGLSQRPPSCRSLQPPGALPPPGAGLWLHGQPKPRTSLGAGWDGQGLEGRTRKPPHLGPLCAPDAVRRVPAPSAALRGVLPGRCSSPVVSPATATRLLISSLSSFSAGWCAAPSGPWDRRGPVPETSRRPHSSWDTAGPGILKPGAGARPLGACPRSRRLPPS